MELFKHFKLNDDVRFFYFTSYTIPFSSYTNIIIILPVGFNELYFIYSCLILMCNTKYNRKALVKLYKEAIKISINGNKNFSTESILSIHHMKNHRN